jgi:hypothetical protein
MPILVVDVEVSEGCRQGNRTRTAARCTVEPVAGLVSKTWTKPGAPDAPGVNVMLAE